jgi:AcrR family transcriptional regulator
VSEARRSGGRPTAQAALLLESAILDQATAAFLRDGYAAVTIEAIARACSVAKRTIYARWSGKPALFRAVLEGLIAKWLATADEWPDGDGLEPALRRAADQVLAVALTPEAVALHRLVTAECGRFPELSVMLREAGANLGALRLAQMLDRAVARGDIPAQDTAFAAEQFLHMLLAGPQRRARGRGPPPDRASTQIWRDRAVRLFLGGINSF